TARYSLSLPDALPIFAPWWQRISESVRAALRAACEVLSEEPAGLLPGLVVGDTSELSKRVEQEFLDAGLSHLTAVSGSNVAILRSEEHTSELQSRENL